MFPVPNTFMALQGRLFALELIAGIFLSIVLFQLHVLTCPAPHREPGFGPIIGKKKKGKK